MPRNKIIIFIITLFSVALLICGCSDSNSQYGYGDPKPGESMSDYMKREDPGLYKEIEKNYYNAFD